MVFDVCMINNYSMQNNSNYKMNLLYAFGLILFSCINYFSGFCDAEPIVGGHFDLEEEAIWVVSIQIFTKNEWKPFCGGSLISERDIVTAAHCFVKFACENPKPGKVSKNILINLRKKKLRVIIGLNDLIMKEITPSRGIEKTIKRAFIHRDYVRVESRARNDLAVIRLAEPLTEADKETDAENKFGFIKLFSPDENNKASNHDLQGEVFGAGFGVVAITAEGNYERDGLRKILKLHFTDDRASHQFPGVKLVQYKGDAQTARGFCMGDSGGPIYFKSDKNDFQLVGVISSGPCDCDMRNSTGNTGKVTFISEYLEFLKAIEDVDESQIIEETSLKKYEKTGNKYFALPDHHMIAKRKYFGGTVA